MTESLPCWANSGQYVQTRSSLSSQLRECARARVIAARPLVAPVDQDHRALFPGLAGRLVGHAAPQVHDFLTLVIHTVGTPRLVPPSEIRSERLSHGLKARADVSLDMHAFRRYRRRASSFRPILAQEHQE